MEKKRRARINRSLESLLHLLVASDVCHPPTRVHKYDKADILEMTLKHLKKLHQNSDSPGRINSYKFGFNQCLRETVSIIQSLQIRGCCDVAATLQNKMNEYYSENRENMEHFYCNFKEMWRDDLRWEQDQSNFEGRKNLNQGERIKKPSLDQNNMWRPW